MSKKADSEKKKSKADQQLERIKKLLKTIPESPGVYKMKDENEKIIYIGKAKNLRHRVAQYFQLSKTHSIKVQKMVEKIQDVDYIEVNSEMEALVLETNLIKELKPRYNVLMRDDKNYVYIKVNTAEDYPRISIVRQREKDRALYFGPKTSADRCDKMLAVIRKIFPIRTCSLEMEEQPDGLVKITKKTIPVPCLDYHIKRCAGPCIDKMNKQDYNALIKQIISFLKGSYQELITQLKYQMFNQAKEKQFEKAAKLRDQIKAVEDLFKKQLVSDPEFIDRDVIGIHPDFDKTFINLFQFREGKLINQENFTLDTPQVSSGTEEEQSSSIIESFLRSYYSEASDIPSEIYLREPPIDQALWEEWLSEYRHELNKLTGTDDRKNVHFLRPIKGKKNKILELSEKNAATFAKQSRAKWMSDAAKTSQAAKDLADELGLEKELKRIECYDISHMGGEHTTASMVVFQKGSAEKKQYRHFKLKGLENGEVDDYKALQEIITRRLQRLSQFSTPDLEGYSFKKPLKKDQESITKTLKTKVKELNFSQFVGLYFEEEEKNNLIGFTHYSEHNEGQSIQLKNTWIEGEHNNRALKHQLWSHLIDKLKKIPHLYVICETEQKEDYLSYGFTELKKVPDFLKASKQQQKPIYLIYKITKKSKNDSSFTQTPDLIILDGGKGQLNAGLEVLHSSGLNIPMVGLAKKEEEIFMPQYLNEKDEYHLQRITLPKNSQALYLVQRIRDESHRFANELRKKLGSKKLTESEIDDIPGIGLIIKRRLLKEYGSINAIKAADIKDLEKTVGAYIAKMLKEKLGDTSQQ